MKKNWIISGIVCLYISLSCSFTASNELILCCRENNDLYVTLKANKIACKRYQTPTEAINRAKMGQGVMILADHYPEQTTVTDATLYEKAQQKNLRLYVEYPSYIPGVKTGTPRGTLWERAVVSSDAFAPALQNLRILAIHDCKFIPVEVENPDIVIARVAGFDNAVYGLPKEKFPILVQIPQAGNHEGLLVSTTKLSQFITARFAPADAWTAVWKHIFTWLQPGKKAPDLKWTVSVRPSYGKEETLPEDAERQALKRGIDWYFNSRMFVTASMMEKYNLPVSRGNDGVNFTNDWLLNSDRIGEMPDLSEPVGDGSLGVLEGFDARIYSNGTQPVRWWRRSDCNGETAGALAIAGTVFDSPNYAKVGGNIGDWLYFKSIISLGDRDDPNNPAYGLFGWNDVPHYTGPGTMNGYDAYYGDDNARNMLGMMLAAATLKTDRYNERLMKGLLGNLRVTGVFGFQPERINKPQLVNNGWQYFNQLDIVHYSGNFQAYMWVCYLWAYQQTGYEPFLKHAKTAIGIMMSGYPQHWGSVGFQVDLTRMVLPLAWLVRVEDTPEHRSWLRMVVEDMKQDEKTGAIQDVIEVNKLNLHYRVPASNEAYGTTEAPLIQSNEDACSDLLYAVNFAFIGLHEASVITGDKFYKEAEDKLAKFLCRIQIRSEAHPELDGGWFRAFDFKRWEYWASSSDIGWGAWSIETGWSQNWITITLALRQLNTSLWDITANRNIKQQFDKLYPQFFPK